MRRGGAAGPLALLALLLAAAYALHAARMLYVVGGVGTLAGWRFAFALALFFACCAGGTLVPPARFGLLLAASILQLVVFHGPIRAAGALILWSGFFLLVRLPVTWWTKGPAAAILHAAPIYLAWADPGSALLGILLVMHFASGFVLRSALYAYEATMKKDQLRGAGYGAYLLYLAAPPLGAVKLAPIGFAVLHQGFRKEADPALVRRGTGEMALGFAYLALKEIAGKPALLPTYPHVVEMAGDLHAASAFLACHLLLLRLFLDVAGHVHLAVGMLRSLGFDVPSGTERPYLSRNVLDFWRRWNTYYRDYLMTLAYYPIAMALRRRPFLAVALGGAATFLLSGFTHAVQLFVRHPEELSVRRLVEAHAWAFVFGSLVVAWMIRERIAARRRKAAGPGSAGQASPRPASPVPASIGRTEPRPAPRASGLRLAGSIALTMSVMSVVLLFLFPAIHGLPLSSVLQVLAAFTRLPGR